MRVEVGRDPLTGRRQQKSRSVSGSKREAQQVLNALLVEAQSGQLSGTNATFERLASEWLDLTEANLSPTTVRRYRNLLKNHIFPGIGSRRVESIRTSDLDRLYLSLSSTAMLSPATVRQIHAIIRRAFRQAVLWGWIATNPASNSTPPKLVRRELTPPTPEQVSLLLRFASSTDPEMARYLHIAASTGARRGEICALRWRNVDTENRTLTIDRSIIEIPGGLAEKDTKTHASRRNALDAGTLSAIEEQRRSAEEQCRTIGGSLDESSYVFSPDPAGAVPYNPGTMTKRFERLRKALGLEGIRLHDFRHFTATRLIAAGVPVRTVSGRLGHANPSTTLAVYSHFVEASDFDAAEIIGNIIESD